jgi:hypothetical protein
MKDKILLYHDEYSKNTATIEELNILPYNGAKHKEIGFRLTLTSHYDDIYKALSILFPFTLQNKML